MRKKGKVWMAVLTSIVLGMSVGCGIQNATDANTQDGNVIGNQSGNQYSQDLFAMDTYMTFTAYGKSGKQAVEDAIDEVERLDKLWSVSSKDGEVYQINEKGKGSISSDTEDVLHVAQQLHQSTQGAFDITIYPLMDLWGFTSGNYKVPEQEELKKTMKLVDQNQIKFDEDTKGLTLGTGQKIDFGAIAKGYTSNRVMELWKQEGITSGMVSLGGNVQVLGVKTDGSKWHVGIQNPDKNADDMIGVVSISDEAVITSGGYERNFEENGKTYHHILDTKTGYPAESGLCSVTIVSADGTLADGLSTSLFIMGKEKALSYWREHQEEFDTILVEEDGIVSITEGLKGKFTSDYDFTIVK